MYVNGDIMCAYYACRWLIIQYVNKLVSLIWILNDVLNIYVQLDVAFMDYWL